MMPFTEFLNQRLAAGGFTTEDVLACVLPLVRQVVAAHRAGKIAPLQGIDAIHVDENRLWFEESQLREPLRADARVRELEAPAFGAKAVEVVGQYRVDLQVEHGNDTYVSMQVGKRGEPVAHPVYLPGYISWEHELGHHDPLTDTFVLGLILAACAGDFDLNDPADLAEFVVCRRNLFERKPQLHPVVAKAITRMTELDRRRRPQDLAALLRALENYRDQEIDFDSELARNRAFEKADRPGKRALILSCLQQRLFEISRRNRLLHFRATSQSVNLTWASVPLSFDLRNVRAEQIVTWGHDFKDAVVAGKPIALNKYLRFEEALYLPGQLDEIRNEARRDQTEYGFAQLRLVICFLRWANLKESGSERYDSPLVLLPVRLSKTKGVRDVYTLEPASSEAEINPVLRVHLKQLYAVDLPDFVTLSPTALDDLHAHLASKIQASEPAVTVEKIDKPRINLIHAKAQRRLEQYRRRARLSGRGVRTFHDLDYSYDRDNYHPLGLRLFQTRIAAAEPRLRALADEAPRPRSHMVPVDAVPAEADVPRERTLLGQVEAETNPYHWEFDLCNVTLGNFHYRKMSLVRDYTTLLAQTEEHAGFDSIFSLDPREAPGEPPRPLPIEETHPIVPCDPTQASAIALARTGRHFIIQGPPGTGKSQTITNLIADFVAQGKRVLFVCEKRAAIDVVYHRLHQAGLHELCCLIHDAQDDKKEFIFDLKATYDAFLATKEDRAAKTERERRQLLDRWKRELEPLEHFDAAMRSTPLQAGLPLQQLLQRAVELRGQAPDLPARDREQLAPYQSWHNHRDAANRLRDHVQAIRPDGVLATHPLRRLHCRFAPLDRPLEAVNDCLPKAEEWTGRLLREMQELGLAAEMWSSLDRIRPLVEHAASLAFLADHDLLGVLEPRSELAKKFAGVRRKYSVKEQELKRAQVATMGWRQKLSPAETNHALQQMRAQEHSPLRFLSLGWWKLRGVLRRCFDFSNPSVQPTYSQALETLQREHQFEAERENLEAEARDEFHFDGPFCDYAARITALTDAEARLPPFLQAFHREMKTSARGNATVRALAQLRPIVAAWNEVLATLMVDTGRLSLEELRDELALVEESLDELPAFAPCLKELANLPSPLAETWRRLPCRAEPLEAALADHTLAEVLRADPPLARFNQALQSAQLAKVEQIHEQWHTISARDVRDRVCQRFLDHVRIASLPHGQLTDEQKEFKTAYNRGRRELEHEFNKTMRYRSIRDLVGGDSGLVLQDLKPVWLMSPLSVSDALPLACSFDVVIFDEASQVTLEEAIPSLFRAKQVLVVGDEMQLPPTSFFASKGGEEEDSVMVEDATGREVEYDLSSSSFLNHAARNLPATMLGWHYRSRSESLISFSNAAFYQGRLLTVPEVALPPIAMPEILVADPEDGFLHVDRLLERPVSFHFLEKGVYQQRINPSEADYIAQLVRGLLAGAGGPSIGIIAFSEAQQHEIEQALQRLAREDDEFRARLETEREREEDGQFVGLLVKNLENIQGDERDIILLSVCYGRGPNGKMLMNFGPINQSGGERRLNVAFSRAKKHMALVTSIRHSSITNDYNDGARALKNYLRYAEALSAGDTAGARRVLWEINPAETAARAEVPANVVVVQVAARLRERGWHVDVAVGQSGFRCDLAVRAADEQRFRLGVLVDTDAYYQNDNLLERDVLRPRLLRSFGWNVCLVLTKDWLESPDGVLAVIEQHLTGAADRSPDQADDTPPADTWSRCLELRSDHAVKFWDIAVAGSQHTIRFGQRGGKVQSKTKTFADARAADSDARRLVEDKLAKGYVDTTG